MVVEPGGLLVGPPVDPPVLASAPADPSLLLVSAALDDDSSSAAVVDELPVDAPDDADSASP